MTEKKLLCILAHPDDESLGVGGTIAKYSNEGVEVQLICATRGERGRYFDEPSPGHSHVGKIRTEELLSAAEILGIRKVHFLDYIDGDLDQAPVQEISDKIAKIIKEFKPQVVLSFGPDGGYGHPDHIAISQYSLSGILKAGDSYEVQKFYFLAWPEAHWDIYKSAFKKLEITVDSEVRISAPWPEWAVTTRLDTRAHWKTVLEAIRCHKTQLTGYAHLDSLSSYDHKALWGSQEYCRVFSTVNYGRKGEEDLFEGVNLQ